MANERPDWLPKDCTFYGLDRLIPDLTDPANPHIIFVGHKVMSEHPILLVGGGLPDRLRHGGVVQGMSPKWGGATKENAQEAARIWMEDLKYNLNRVYNGLSLRTLQESSARNGILCRASLQCPSFDSFLFALDRYFVKPEYLVKEKPK